MALRTSQVDYVIPLEDVRQTGYESSIVFP